jgi:NAD-dependent dihydropyrimidine dehydrogenase PreA subunit
MKARFERYHIEVKDAPPRFKIPPRFIVKRYNNCSNVQECTQACVYGVHVIGKDNKIAEPLNDLCRGCYVCVLKCPDLAISVEENPESQHMGNKYFTADRMRTIYFEAEGGKVPVSGTGYNGPFAGKGFDGMWFDFSEIVRPTRDGIHGREFISTSVDLGRRPSRLVFDERGKLLSDEPKIIEIPIPMILEAPLASGKEDCLHLAVVKAASKLRTFAMVDFKDFSHDLLPYASNIVPRFRPNEIRVAEDVIRQCRIVEVDLKDRESGTQDFLERIRAINPSALISFRFPYYDGSHEEAYMLTEKGADVIHLYMSDEDIERDPDGITSAIQRTHSYLVEKNVREKVTLISSGGVAEAAHVPKSIILGADAVGVGLAYQIALGCKVCYGDHHSKNCELRIKKEEVEWAVQRIANLVGSWRDQLLEVLGGMGLREVRRQRGEMGRAMFYNDLEAKIFGGRE